MSKDYTIPGRIYIKHDHLKPGRQKDFLVALNEAKLFPDEFMNLCEISGTEALFSQKEIVRAINTAQRDGIFKGTFNQLMRHEGLYKQLKTVGDLRNSDKKGADSSAGNLTFVASASSNVMNFQDGLFADTDINIFLAGLNQLGLTDTQLAGFTKEAGLLKEDGKEFTPFSFNAAAATLKRNKNKTGLPDDELPSCLKALYRLEDALGKLADFKANQLGSHAASASTKGATTQRQ